jgi:uncharacterized protein (DUF1330 family)
MAAFCIGTIHVKDAAEWERYRSQVGGTVHKFGGEVVMRGKRAASYQGKQNDELVVVLKFADMAAANRWHESADYQALIATRDRGADVTLTLYSE